MQKLKYVNILMKIVESLKDVLRNELKTQPCSYHWSILVEFLLNLAQMNNGEITHEINILP